MPSTFTQRLRVRRYECDSLGHVNNAIYIQYLDHITDEAFAAWSLDEASWQMQRISAEYLGPAVPRDELEISTWVRTMTAEQLTTDYEMRRVADGASITRAEIGWRGRDEQVTTEAMATMQAIDQAVLKPFVIPAGRAAKPFRWRHVVRRYELNTRGEVSPAVYFNWLEQVVFRAGELKGWTPERMKAEDILILQRRHDAEFFAAARYLDEIEIVSRIVEVRRVRGTWLHEIYNTRSGVLLMRDYSEGAFLSWEGRIRPTPQALIEELSQGE